MGRGRLGSPHRFASRATLAANWTARTCSEPKTNRSARQSGGDHEPRTCFKDRVGAGGIALFGFKLPFGDVYAAGPCDGDDVQPLRHAGGFPALAIRNPSAHRSLIAFTAWSSFAHAGVMGFQAMRNMIAHRELIGVAVLVVIGVAFVALAPAKQPSETASRQISYQPH